MTDNQPPLEPTVPMHNQDAEEAILGSMFTYDTVFPELYPILQTNEFFFVRNGWIWEAARAVYERGEPVDNLTVTTELKARGQFEDIGGIAYISHLINSPYVDMWHAQSYAGLIKHMAARRQLLNAASEIANAAANANATTKDIVEHCEETLFNVTRTVQSKDGVGEVSAGQAAESVFDDLLAYTVDQREIRGYRTGVDALDKKLHGIQRGDLIALIGRSGSGKTTMMRQFIKSFAEQGLNVVVFPTEQTVAQYTTNLIGHILGVTLEDLHLGKVKGSELARAESIIKSWPLTFFDRTAPSPQQVVSFAREKVRQGRCDIVVVDGMNDMWVPGEIYNKTVECMNALHSLMRDGVPVVFTVQANRGPSDRKNKRPLMSDAQGGGVIEQKATRFLSLYRPAYDVETGEVEAAGRDVSPGYVELQILKDRFYDKQGTIIKSIWIPGKGFKDASAPEPQASYSGNGHGR